MASHHRALATLCLMSAAGTIRGHPSYVREDAEKGSIRGCGRSGRRKMESAEEAPKVVWQQFATRPSAEELDRLETASSDREAFWTRLGASSTTPATSAAASINLHSMEDILLHEADAITVSPAAPSTMLLRRENAFFADGTSSIATDARPNARDISNAFHSSQSMPNSLGASDWLWAFGQFLNHDVSEVNVKKGDSCDISISPNDPFLHGVTMIPMSRSKFELDESNVAQQMNEMTSAIDAESVYGTTPTRLSYIRAEDSAVTGRLRTSANNLLPKNGLGQTNRGGDDDTELFLAGDRLRDCEGHGTGHHAKDRVDEFLPALLGEGSIPEYDGYKPEVDTRLENIVSACAYRLGHTLVGESLTRDCGNGTVVHLPLGDAFFAPEQLEMHGLDPFLRGMATNTCEEVDPFLVPTLRNQLFAEQFDLLALNIERGRDHGIPDFNTIRERLGFEKMDSFDDFLFGQKLASVYSDIDQIDCWIGMNSEPRIKGLMVGPPQQAVLARNFAIIRDGDEHFYKNSIRDAELPSLIEGTTFADVIRKNSDAPGSLDDMQGNVFFVS